MKELRIEGIGAYELTEKREIPELESVGYLLSHKKTGARICLLANEDNNKVFTIGFHTPPADSTGLPHILEHSVLCGSKHFPAKDPFVELVKGSLNTFLNAMTYPDKTVYPVASCNDQDFQNLMHVYMDAVFYPNIYDREEIFRQEGWHYDLESEDAPLKINGVVYNEMKGAFSSPEGVLDREVLNSLFPDTSYANESGGDPACIPDLKYSEFLSFHSKYYHPSNSYIYLYGDMDMEEKLNWLDEAYLSKYDRLPVPAEQKLQEPFEKPVEVRKQYSISQAESEEDNTYLSYNLAIATSLDKELYLAFQILEYALLSAPGAPLKQAILDAGIGKDVMSSYDNGVYQPIFSIIAKNANTSQKEAFLKVIRDTLTTIAEEGMDEKALRAGINYFEFRYREADFGNYPKGLMYGLQAFDSWLYDDQAPFLHLEALDTFAFLKEQVGKGYFEQLIRKYLMENPHASVVIIEPKKGLTAELDQKLAEKLQAYKESLSAEEIQALIAQTKHLEEYQSEPSTQEELEKIPMLTREDIGKEAAPFQNEERKIGEQTFLYHDLFTNGIGYLTLLFDVKQIPEELIPYFGILKKVLGYVDTEKRSYREFYNEVNMLTGGISCDVNAYGHVSKEEGYRAFFEVRTKVLYENMDFAVDMMREMLLESVFTDEKRLYEIIAQLKSRLQMVMNTSGHVMALLRSMSYFSNVSYFSDLTGGVGFYKTVEKIERSFETEKADLICKLKELTNLIFCRENLMVSYTGERGSLEKTEMLMEKLSEGLYQKKGSGETPVFHLEKKNEGFGMSSKIQYVARSGNFRLGGFDYTGAFRILKVILSYDYLWQNIRVKGGAYGCMSSFTRGGDCYLVSYRDPNLERTNQVFEETTAYLESFTVSERDMVKYIIGTISDLDTPLNPSAKGNRSLGAYLTGVTFEDVQRERDEILNADAADIRALAGPVGEVLSQQNLCVLGNEEKLAGAKEMFEHLESLFS